MELVEGKIPPNGVSVIVSDAQYTPELCRDNPNLLFVFGDNILGRGKGGQANIRDEPNTYGIVTKAAPHRGTGAYLSDGSAVHAQAVFDSVQGLCTILESTHNTYTHEVFPAGGLGTGLAQLNHRAPHIFSALNAKLLELFGVTNVY